MRKMRINSRLISTILLGGVILSGCSIKRDVERNKLNQEQPVYTESTIDYEEPAMLDNQVEVVYEQPKTYTYQEKNAAEATAGVNVRKGPSTDDDIIGGLTIGTKMEVISHQNGWYQIDYFGQTGYVCDDYAKDATIISGTPMKMVYCNDRTTFTGLNGELISFNQYEVASVYEEFDDKYFVAIDNKLGYISKYACTDLNGTYAIVDKSDQRLDIYQNGELILSSPVVTGKDATPTTSGCHEVVYKMHDDYLVGEDYKQHVNHFLAFYDGQGLHDADWKMLFGNDGYHEKGSHGCVNLPVDVAENVNDVLQVGDKVLVKQ